MTSPDAGTRALDALSVAIVGCTEDMVSSREWRNRLHSWFRKGVRVVSESAVVVPREMFKDLLLLEFDLARVTDELKHLPDLRREDELMLVAVALQRVRSLRAALSAAEPRKERGT